MYSFHSENKVSGVAPEEIARLLRSIGASGRLVGFHYTVYIVYHILQKPDEYFWITKCAYPETARYFKVSPSSVEHAIRTLIASVWNRRNHSNLTRVAGIELEKPPTNSEFIAMIADHLNLRKKQGLL